MLPGSERTENHNHPDPGSKTLFRLATALAKVNPQPELVLVDCPPSLGQLTRSALTAADRAVLVTEPSLFAVTGVQRALEAVQTERLAHRPAPAAARRGDQPVPTAGDRARVPAGRAAGPVRPAGAQSPVLPDRSAVQQAQGAAVPIHQWPTAGAREIAQSFDALLDRLMRSGKVRGRK